MSMSLSDVMAAAAKRAKAYADSGTDHIGYTREMDVEGEMMIVMFDGGGEPIAMSRSGMVPIMSYSANRGIELLTRH